MAIVDIARVLVFTFPGAKLAGPVQAYVAPDTTGVVMIKAAFSHGVFTTTAGITGIRFTVTNELAVALHDFISVISKLKAYGPESVPNDVKVGAATLVLFNFAAPAPVHTYEYVGVPATVTVLVIADVDPAHIVAGVGVIVTVGFGFIVIVIGDRGPSQLGAAVNFCDTQ
jgi:hypothetical protein